MSKLVSIRMKQLSAGPEGVRKPGQVVAVSAEEAEQLIAGNYAEAYAPGPETASIEAPEKAVQPKPQRKQPAPPELSGPEAELADLVGNKPARSLIETGVNSIEAALDAMVGGVDLTEIKGVGAGTVEKLAALLPPELEDPDELEAGNEPFEPEPDEGDGEDGGEEETEAEADEA